MSSRMNETYCQHILAIERMRPFNMRVFDAKSADDLLLLLERVRRDGAIFFLKFDGLRLINPYTAIIHNTSRDLPTPYEAMAFIIVTHAQYAWGYQPGGHIE